MRNLYVLIILSYLLSESIFSHPVLSEICESAEPYSMKGIVRDKTTSEPLIFVNIQVQGTSLGTTTDDAGQFALTLPKGDGTVYDSAMSVIVQIHSRYSLSGMCL